MNDRLETGCDQVEPSDEARFMRRRRTTIVSVCAVLLAAALYEAALALRLIPMGKLPGTEPTGGVWVFRLAMLALLVGIALSLLALWREAAPQRFHVLLAPSALAFVFARYYTFDPYYLPTLRRMSTGFVKVDWMIALAAATALTALAGRLAPRTGAALSAVTLFLIAMTTLAVATGH